MLNSRGPRLHYAWQNVIAGTLVLLAILGFGRFALGMLLPSMGEELALGYDAMGYISTGNFIGYLVAVLFSGRAIRQFGFRGAILTGITLAGGSMLGLSLANGFFSVLFAFFLTGIGSGLANIPMMGMVSHWFRGSLRGRAAGIMLSGNGIGIMLTGLMIPLINQSTDAGGWRIGWGLLGAMILLLALICSRLLRSRPEHYGVEPLGTDKAGQPGAQSVAGAPADQTRALLYLAALYFMFGFTYVIYATFVVVSLVQDYAFSEAQAGQFWFWIGLISILSGPLFGSLSDHIGRKQTLLMVFSLQASAYLLLALQLEINWLYLSLLLYAICVWSIPPIIAATIGDQLGPERAASAFGMVTLIFGIGQISGPALAGILAEQTGSFAASYLLAFAVATTAILVTALLKQR